MTPLVWKIRSYNPYNRIGKHALQDIYNWAHRNLLSYNIIYEKKSIDDMILIRGHIKEYSK